jgi:hypothetical protein
VFPGVEGSSKISKKFWGDLSSVNPYVSTPVEVPKMIEHLHHAPYRNKELLEQKYLLERRSIKEISREWACSRSVVAKYLKD